MFTIPVFWIVFILYPKSINLLHTFDLPMNKLTVKKYVVLYAFIICVIYMLLLYLFKMFICNRL